MRTCNWVIGETGKRCGKRVPAVRGRDLCDEHCDTVRVIVDSADSDGDEIWQRSAAKAAYERGELKYDETNRTYCR